MTENFFKGDIVEHPDGKESEKRERKKEQPSAELNNLPGEIGYYFNRLPGYLKKEILRSITDVEVKDEKETSLQLRMRLEKMKFFDIYLGFLLYDPKIGEYLEDIIKLDDKKEFEKLKSEIKRFLDTIWDNRGKLDDNALDDVSIKWDVFLGKEEISRDKTNDKGEAIIFNQEIYNNLKKEAEDLKQNIENKRKGHSKAKENLERAQGKVRESAKRREIELEKYKKLQEAEEKLRSFWHGRGRRLKNKKQELDYTEKVSKLAEWLEPDEFSFYMEMAIEGALSYTRLVIERNGIKDLGAEELGLLGVKKWEDLDMDNLKELGFKTAEEASKEKGFRGFYVEDVFKAIKTIKSLRKAMEEWYEEHKDEESMREFPESGGETKRKIQDAATGIISEITKKQQTLIDYFEALYNSFLNGRREGKSDKDLSSEIRQMENALNILRMKAENKK